MPQYDYSNEPNNPWDLATWDPRAQIDFMRRMRYKFGGSKGNAEARIMQRIAQSDTKGMPPRKVTVVNKVFLIHGRPGAPGKDGKDGAVPVFQEFLSFYGAGLFTADQYFNLAPVPTQTTFPTTKADNGRANCRVASAVDTTFYLVESVADFLADGSGLICTVTFLAGQTTGTFTYGAPSLVTVGTVLFIMCPHVPDENIQDVQISFCGDPN